MVQLGELPSKVIDLDIDFNRDSSRLLSPELKERAMGIVMDTLSMDPLSLPQLADRFGVAQTRALDDETLATFLIDPKFESVSVTQVANEAYLDLAKLLQRMLNRRMIYLAVNHNDPTIENVTGHNTYVYYRADQEELLENAERLRPSRIAGILKIYQQEDHPNKKRVARLLSKLYSDPKESLENIKYY